jgi:two-component system sensor histidine kinase UhpB
VSATTSKPAQGRGAGRPVALLVVEDVPEDLAFLVDGLERAGLVLDVCRVDTPRALIEALQRQAWDAVISDYHVPGFGAREALAIIKNHGFDGPFIVVSSKIGEEAAVELMRSGAHDFVMKSDMSRLAPALNRELGEAANRRAHRRAIAELQAREVLLRNVTSNMGEGLLVCDGDGGLLLMNPEAERILGWDAASIGKREVHALLQPARSRGGAAGAFSMLDAVRRGGAYRGDAEIWQRRDGSEFPVACAISLLGGDGAVTGTVTVFRDITERRKTELQVRELTQSVRRAREDEQARIARELHDELGQMLTVIKLEISLLGATLDASEDGAKRKVAAICARVDEAMEAVRRIAADLRPVMLEDLGLCAAIDWQLGKLRELTRAATTLNARPENFDLDPTVAFTAYRVVQECLSNVARHARATEVTVSVEHAGDMLALEITDNGVGMPQPPAARSHTDRKPLGLIGLRERVESVGGQFSTHSAPGSGTTVRARVPWIGAATGGAQP